MAILFFYSGNARWRHFHRKKQHKASDGTRISRTSHVWSAYARFFNNLTV